MHSGLTDLHWVLRSGVLLADEFCGPMREPENPHFPDNVYIYIYIYIYIYCHK